MNVILKKGLEIVGRLSGLIEIGGMGKKRIISIRGTRMSKTHDRLGPTSQTAPSSMPDTQQVFSYSY